MSGTSNVITLESFITSYANYTLDQCFALPDAQEVACVEQQLNITDPPSIYSFAEYPALWEPISCYLWNVTLGFRVDVASTFNYCTVPLRGSDAFLFVSIALLTASALFGRLSAVWALVAGGIVGVVNYYANLLQISNAISLWLSIQPADLFLYAFLPPLLLESSIRLDFFVLSKIWVHALILAIIMVLIFAMALAPFILFALGFNNRGWSWVDGAVFSAILSPTDAISVAAILTRSNGPERLVALMEAESLFNDASALTLYQVFSGIFYSQIAQSPPVWPSVWSVIPEVLLKIVRLSAIGLGIGLGMSWATGYLLQWLRWRGGKPYIETTVVLAVAYLAYYVAQSPAEGSGVTALVVFGLYGNATSKWGMLARSDESGDFDAAWDFISFAANGLVFFWSGVASVNYTIRSVSAFSRSAWSYAAVPLIFIYMLILRLFCIALFNPFFNILGEGLSIAEIIFVGWCGLRGSLSLIMASSFTTGSSLSFVDTQAATDTALVNADISLWTSTFVLLTLLINGPTIGPIMKLLNLDKIPPERINHRSRVKRALSRFTDAQVTSLRENDAGFLKGADWKSVAQYVDVSPSLWGFDTPSLSTRPIKGAFGNDDRDKGKNGLRVLLKNKFLAALYCCGGLQLSDSCPKPKDAPSISGTNGDEDHRGIRFVSDRSDGDDEGEGEGEGGMHRVSAAPHESVSDHDLESGLQATPFPSRVSDDLDSSQTVPATMGKSLQREMRGLEGGNEDSKSVADQNLGWESCLATVSGALGSNLQSEFRRHMMSMPQRDVHARNVDMLERRLMRDISRRRQGQLDAGQAGHADLNGPQASVSSTLLEMKKSTSRNELEKLQGMVKADANGIQNSSLPQRTVSQPPSHRRMESLGIDRSDVQSGRPQGESWVRAGLLSRTFSLLNTKERSVVVDDADSVAQHDDTIISSISGASGMHSVEGGSNMDRSASLQSRPDDATLTEHRLRLLSGIKRTLVARRMQGLLTVEGLRMLQYACDSSAHHADHPIQVWSVLERNVSGGWATWTVSKLAKASTWVYFYMPRFLKYIFAWPSTQWGNLLSGFLSRRMLEACEIAVEYYLALLNSPQVHWMRLHGDVYHHVLLEEVESESKAAHAFISDREKEVPDRFQAIQSYRSAMALLRRQLHYLSELFEIGIIDKGEHRMLVKPVDKKILRLEIAGPVWRPPKPREMLRSLKYMCALSEESFEKIWSAGVLRELGKGEHFWIASDRPSSLNSGVYFILSGGVTCIHVTSEGKRKEEFQGAGGLVGALLSLAGSRVPGKEWAVAEGNAVGRGPLVFFLPQSFISTQIVELYNSGDEEMEIFEDILLKEAAVYVVSCLEHEILQAVKTHVEDAVNTATLLQEGHDSMKKSNSRSFRSETKPSMASLRRRFSLNSGGQNTNLKKRTPSSLRKRSTSQMADTGYSGSQHQNLDAMMRHITDVVELRDDEVEVDLHYSSRAAGGEDDASFAKVTETTKRWSNGMDVPLNSPEKFVSTDGGKGDATEPGQLAVEDGLPNHNVPKQRMVRFTSSYGKGRNSKNSLDIASALQGIQHFATEVAMDIRKCLPKSFILRLPRGSELLQTTHVVLLAGSLISDESQHNVSKAPNDLVAKHVDEIIGPYVLPWLWDARLIPDVSRQGLVVTGKLWYAGVDGATVAVCCHHNGSLPEAIETLNN